MRRTTPKRLASRVNALDWPSIGAALDDVGCAVTPSVLSAQECRALVELYDTGRFRKTIDMARHRFGSGEYRYFERPLPQLPPERARRSRSTSSSRVWRTSLPCTM